MRFITGVILLIVFSNLLRSQSTDFNLILVDTGTYFNVNQLTGRSFDKEVIIDNDSIFRSAFLYSRLKMGHPNFNEHIWLKRTLTGNCLTQIENHILVDSNNRKINWMADIQTGDCHSKTTRHLIIEIPKPPSGYTIHFDVLETGSDAEQSDPKTIPLKPNRFFCGLSFFPHFTALPSVISNDRDFAQWQKGDTLCSVKPDFEKELILTGIYGGDCMMELIPHIFFDSVTNTLILDVYNIWGGCRAGGQRSLAMLVEKPNDNFGIVFHEILVDNIEEYMHKFGQEGVDK